MLFIAIIFIITGATGTQLNSYNQSSKRDLCENYVQYPSTIQIDYNIVYIVCIIISITFFILAVYFFLRDRRYAQNLWELLLLPGVLVILGGIGIGLSVLFYNKYIEESNKRNTPLNPGTDQKLIDYCSKKDQSIDNMYVAFVCFFTVGVISIALYLGNFLTSICVSSYRY